jgi:thiaminase/transcriptional activator TenA
MSLPQEFKLVGAEAGTTSARLYAAAEAIWAAQLNHPFVKALGEGSLPRANFEYYIRQDARFLEDLTRIFAYGAIKSHRPEIMEQMGKLLLNTIRVERELHQGFAREFGLTIQEMETTPRAPTNYAYTRHLLSIGATGSLAQIITSALPCAWIYAEVGRHFTRLDPLVEDHPYKNWISAYSSPDFEEVGAWMRTTLNEQTVNTTEDEFRLLEDIFITSSRYEYMFWEMAWRKEEWPV